MTTTTTKLRMTFTKGTRVVRCSRNDQESPWTCCLWVNNGEDITQLSKSCMKVSTATKWAEKVLSRD